MSFSNTSVKMKINPSGDKLLRLHHFLPYSYANGPGARAVLWLQGCTLGCPGCFNPETHPLQGGELISVEQAVQRILVLQEPIEGITISGGEPMQQRQALLAFLKQIRAQTELSVLLFSGFTWEEIQHFPQAAKLRAYVDILITGRYIESQRLAHGLLGSSNKRVHFLTHRYTPQDLQSIPEAEIILTDTGEILMSGIDPLKW
jgi:anaerobic ribonucleoside-triphosphate reductase activating protein